MHLRPAALITAVVLCALAATRSVEAQSHKFKLGGGAGFASLHDPELNFGRTFVVGGLFGFRFNDNFSFETGFNLARSNRVYNEDGVPIDDVQALPAFRFQTNRYQIDGTLVYNIGRRQPFHPYIVAGGGLVRRKKTRTDVVFETNETGQDMLVSSEVVLDTAEYEAAAHFGAGVEIYFLYNVAARVEYRFYIPQSFNQYTRQFYFGATYFFGE